MRKALDRNGSFLKFRAAIFVPEFKSIDLGGSEYEYECALWYDAAASLLFGKSQLRNLPDEPITPELMRYVEDRIGSFKQRKKLREVKKVEEGQSVCNAHLPPLRLTAKAEVVGRGKLFLAWIISSASEN